MRQVLLCIGLCVAVLASPESEFDVSFGTKKPLGLQLDQGLKVIGFQRMRAGVLPPAEANGWIKVGDKLISVNEESTAGVPLHDVVRMIAKGEPAALHYILLVILHC